MDNVSRKILLALVLVVSQHPAGANGIEKSSHEQRCRFDFNRYPECTKLERRRLNARFGLPPLETLYRRQHAASDMIIATASFKLGGGLAMVFQRDRQGKPFANIHRMQMGNEKLRPLRINLSEEAWNSITARSRTTDVNLYEDDKICVGGANFTLQMIDEKGNFRSRMGDVCSEHPGNWFFDELAETALAELPLCASLAPEGYGEAWAGSKLYDCFMLGGDREKAAAAYNFLEGTSFWSTWNSDEVGTRAQLAADIEFRWDGRPLPLAGNDLATALTESRFEPFRLEATSYSGQLDGTVVVRGKVKVRHGDAAGPEEKNLGTFLSIWVPQAEYGFRLIRFDTKQD